MIGITFKILKIVAGRKERNQNGILHVKSAEFIIK